MNIRYVEQFLVIIILALTISCASPPISEQVSIESPTSVALLPAGPQVTTNSVSTEHSDEKSETVREEPKASASDNPVTAPSISSSPPTKNSNPNNFEQSPTPTAITHAIPLDESEPRGAPHTVVLNKKYFTILYDTQFRLPRYVEYNLTAEHLRESFVKRRNHFHTDNELEELGLKPVQPDDYKYSGYDRGHMAPSGDFAWSEEASEETFVMSNMAPQSPSLNRGAWEALENQVRKWACGEGQIEVFTGPILSKDMTSLPSGIPIPKQFFKVVLEETLPRKAIGFIMNQSDRGSKTYLDRHVPVRELEKITGIDFFEKVESSQKTQLENQDDLTILKEGDCKGHSLDFQKSAIIQSFSQCSIGKLKSASTRGCCSHHHGVMGPKNFHACCNENNEVICNDNSISSSCRCISN
jgi:endonuclease G